MPKALKFVLALLGIFLGVVALLIIVAAIRALLLEESPYDQLAGHPTPEMAESYLKDLPVLYGRALQYRTVSEYAGVYDREELEKFHGFLHESFPHVFDTSFITVEKVNNYSLLFTVQGNDSSLPPYMLAAHMDVVPAITEEWSRDPFAGDVITDNVTGEEVIWGRGAIDDKLGVMGILMALEYLVRTGWQPSRTFYIALGHDEEVRGEDGAAHIAATLRSRNVTSLDFVLDEGMAIFDGIIQGVDGPVATIGVTEKGWMSVKLTTSGSGGHSSMPPLTQAIATLAHAITRLATNPHPSYFGKGPEEDMFLHLAPKARWPFKLIFANTWLFKPLLELVLSRERETNALIRTTTALSFISSGIKINVVPTTATAIINHRIHPGQTLKDVIDYDRAVIGDPSVELTVLDEQSPHPVSPYGPDVPGFRSIAAAVKSVYSDAVIVPSMLVGNTDTRHYMDFTPRLYRFLPITLTKDDVQSIHGKNEKLSVRNVRGAVRFYHAFVRLLDRDRGASLVLPGRRFGEL